jgi:hypothetical protein
MIRSEDSKSSRCAAAGLLATVTQRETQSEGAPVPVTGNRGSNLGCLALGFLGVGVHVLGRVGHGHTGLLSVDVVLNLVQTVGTVLLPALVGAPAEVTSARRLTLGVEASVLVKWNEVGSVRGAEDVTAVTAVVTTKENTERGATGRRITVGRSRVRLEKC